ncbi:hypothetical protein [Mesomycoplasma ovipneumoniae]|uniref:hypothetical protein n=2 Tax=Mesomycoplasma ovipneumoniae TaxID=29562 RepID=UPI0028AB4229|nr:hypothetical protein [Mesomycoplasma ovipneumoniae]WNM13341.1 hypothetical protein RNL84_03095 [Mesomycoplasma ovipneumoniae]
MDIVQLEVKNLSIEEKEVFYKHLKVYGSKKFDPNNLDKLLESYFWNFPADFIAFQKGYKYSVYNQTIQENDFKDFDYEDVVESLTQDQKDKITEYIRLNAKYLKDEGENNYALESLIEELNGEVWKERKKVDKKLWEENKNSKYISTLATSEDDDQFIFFENDDDLIYFGLKKPKIRNALLFWYKEVLNPHHQVNEWIETNHKLELAKKECLEENQKFEEPKLKKCKLKKIINRSKMVDIIKLEIKNLPNEIKEHLYSILRKIEPNQDWEKFKNYSALDESLEAYFRKYPDDFITFQAGIPESLYSQTIQENDFKHLDYEDVIENLNQGQKDKIILDICSMAKYLKDENDNDYDGESYIWEVTDEDWEDLKKFDKKLWEQTKNNKYILVLPKGKDQGDITFFTDDDQLIFFALNDQELAPRLLKRHWKVLDPHYKVNRWIEKKYKLKLAQKDNSKQTKKFKAPKKKM